MLNIVRFLAVPDRGARLSEVHGRLRLPFGVQLSMYEEKVSSDLSLDELGGEKEEGRMSLMVRWRSPSGAVFGLGQ